MPAQSLSVPYEQFRRRALRHDQIAKALPTVDPRLQKMLAELVMMRLFDELQEALSGIALRLACGTTYADGTTPLLLVPPARSLDGALVLFSTQGRPKPSHPKWSKVKYINDSTKYVLSNAEPFRQACTANTLAISEMQAVRNRIAHNNPNARIAFNTVLTRHYGAALNHITPGLFLLSNRFSQQKLDSYIQTCRLIVKTATRS